MRGELANADVFPAVACLGRVGLGNEPAIAMKLQFGHALDFAAVSKMATKNWSDVFVV